MPAERRTDALRYPAWLQAGLVLAALGVGPAVAAEERLFVYPAAGQSAAQLADDRFACHQQAVAESGFDPPRAAMTSQLAPAQAVVKVPPNESEGATGKGMIAGAVAGAAVGAATGQHAEQGAVVGAAVGTLIGNSIERQGAEAAEAQARSEGERQLKEQDDQAAKLAARRVRYKDVFSACLTARGYSVR